MFDIAIIGGGPGGYVAAEKAGKNGLQTILFEKKDLGGVCILNDGECFREACAKIFRYALERPTEIREVAFVVVPFAVFP